MEYYTRYKLNIKSERRYELIKELTSSFNEANYAITETGDTKQEAKWYDHEEHLKNFSFIHNNILFILKGNGEEEGDIWVKYFMDGKMQKEEAKITFEPFNYSKLKQEKQL